MPNPRPLSYYDDRIQDVKTLTPPTSPALIGDKVARVLGAALGQLAADTFERFAEHKEQLLEASQMRVYGIAGDPAELELPARMRPGDDICYVVRNHWHPRPGGNVSIEDLLKHQRVTVLEHRQFAGISVYELRIAP